MYFHVGMSSRKAPKRISSQEWNEVTCVLCTLDNLLQEVNFTNPNEFIANYKYLCETYNIEAEKHLRDQNGMVQDLLKVHFDTHHAKVTKIKNNTKDVDWGWAVFKLSLHGNSFYHVVAIVHNYVIDSIRLPNNNRGVYPWNGHLRGYDSEKLYTLHQIKSFI